MKSNYLNIGIWTFALFFLHACTPKEVRQIPLEDFSKILKKLLIRFPPTENIFLIWLPTRIA